MKDLLKQYAANYAQRGWVCIPVADKRPVVTDWRRIPVAATPNDIEHRFDVKCNGIGIVAGRPSGNLLIVDIDDKQLIPQFESVVGDLAHTMKVTTNHGAHFYYVIGDPLLARSDVHFNFPAIQLIYNTQVVAPPTPGYQLVLDIEPRVISASEYSQIYEFAKSPGDPGLPGAAAPARPPVKVPKPIAAMAAHPPAAAEKSIHVVRYYDLATAHRSRNEALFRAALAARDGGVSAQDYLRSVMYDFLEHRPLGKHRIQRGLQREREMIATVRSAYSRPARQEGQRKGRLWDSIRERCAQTHNMAIWRVLDGLYAVFSLNRVFTRREAIQALEGQVGRDSVVAALESFGGRLFNKRVLPRPPLQKPTVLLNNSKDKVDIECYAVGAQNQEKQKSRSNNPLGRRCFTYTLPPVRRVARMMSVADTHKYSTPITHVSSKEARKALYNSKIERKPGKYANAVMAGWMGISKRTLKRYEKELKIQRQPCYDECPVYTWNADKLPWLDAPKMGFWLQSGSKRYPALATIAVRLLRYKKNVTLKRQLPNFIYPDGSVHQMILPEIRQAIEANAKPAPEKPSKPKDAPRRPDSKKPGEKNYSELEKSPTPKQPKPQREKPARPTYPALDALKRGWNIYTPRHPGDLEGRFYLVEQAWQEAMGCDLSKSGNASLSLNQKFQWRWLRTRSPRIVLNWLATIRAKEAEKPTQPTRKPDQDGYEYWVEQYNLMRHADVIQRVQEFAQKTLSRKRIIELIAEFGEREVDYVTRYLSKRQNVRSPAALLITALQSNARATKFEREAEKWLQR